MQTQQDDPRSLLVLAQRWAACEHGRVAHQCNVSNTPEAGKAGLSDQCGIHAKSLETRWASDLRSDEDNHKREPFLVRGRHCRHRGGLKAADTHRNIHQGEDKVLEVWIALERKHRDGQRHLGVDDSCWR